MAATPWTQLQHKGWCLLQGESPARTSRSWPLKEKGKEYKLMREEKQAAALSHLWASSSGVWSFTQQMLAPKCITPAVPAGITPAGIPAELPNLGVQLCIRQVRKQREEGLRFFSLKFQMNLEFFLKSLRILVLAKQTHPKPVPGRAEAGPLCPQLPGTPPPGFLGVIFSQPLHSAPRVGSPQRSGCSIEEQ